MSMRKIWLLVAGVVAILAVSAVFAVLLTPPERLQQSVGVAAIGGPFTLVDEEGRTVTAEDFRGKPTVIYFGFTFCPDVCPTTLYELSGLIKRLGDDAEKLNFVFVSVDWERDGPEKMKDYVSAFDPHIRGLSGNEQQIEEIAKAYKIYYKKVPTEDGDYTIDHTASVYLMDQDGKFVGTLNYGEDSDSMFAKLKRLAENA
ncbi:protein SCO1/2 [Rhodopseudomonas julia]|uniref:Protein SCO1/2 n=1 Tax=Rhodopseudomonas julia TaxID=200617 RepID=A0ABU0C952_9BRAD|nr:SCO family protein [Rhodopseudomonas julia]MDQ0327057.1 protein SCO1/2 [Rhodopseudomonas julia]